MVADNNVISLAARNPRVSIAMLQLFRLVSPALPIGSYAYSQGLEYAVTDAWVTNERQVAGWITGLLQHSLAKLEVPILVRCYQYWQDNDHDSVCDWSQFLLINRETMELRNEDRLQGQALARLLFQLGIEQAEPWQNDNRATLVAMFALAASHYHIPLADAASGILWMWAENQIAAAIKLVPLGQTDGQRVLSEVIQNIPSAVQTGLSLQAHEIGNSAPGQLMAAARHESQYSRLFRS